MILAVDIGNTNIIIGAMDDDRIYLREKVSTNRTKTEMEYTVDLKMILELHSISVSDITGSIISSVVPQITGTVCAALKKIFGTEPIIVGPGVKNGIHIALDNPAELGADQVANVVAACAEYEGPFIIVDMGTATTFFVVDENKRLIGGMIMPGVRISLDALTSGASQLNGISLDTPKQLIGKNTIDSMKSGILYGNAAMVDGLIDRISGELGVTVETVIATGGMAKRIVPFVNHEVILDEQLCLKGLMIIYKKNHRGN